MTVVCPRCATKHNRRSSCPTCQGQRPFAQQAVVRATVDSNPWRHTPWGRTLIGLLIAQGLFFGLHSFISGFVLAVGDASESTVTPNGPVLTLALQAVTLLAGALLAGSGQTHGAMLGAIVGILNGVIGLVVLRTADGGLRPGTLYLLPLLHGVIGGLAGWGGSTIWKPLPPADPRGVVQLARRGKVKAPRPSLFAGPVHWFRVALGTTLAVAGSLSASLLYGLMLKASDGMLVSDRNLDKWITWEIKALAILAGGLLAGSNTRNPLKQGFFVGVASSFLLIGFEGRHSERLMLVVGLLFVSCLTLGMSGGWFGGQLFPPIVPFKRGRKFNTASLS